MRTAESQRDADRQEIVGQFVEQLGEVARRIDGEPSGMMLVVDEVDSVARQKGTATFFGVSTVMRGRRGINNVAFSSVGIRGTRDVLKDEHPSAGRISRPLEVPPMTDQEGFEVLTRALKTTTMRISDDAESDIGGLGGLPNAVHLLGEQAFEIASAADLLMIDQEAALDATTAVIEEAAREDFDSRYIASKGVRETSPGTGHLRIHGMLHRLRFVVFSDFGQPTYQQTSTLSCALTFSSDQEMVSVKIGNHYSTHTFATS